jgi:hypothetical protein
MIRFLPDSWWDVVMRPLDMISPEANMYVEVAAPDLRLAAAFVLGIALLACGRRVRADRRPALTLFGFTLLAMVPWLATTGNGRYFTPFLMLLGPLCVGLVRLLPLSRSMGFATVAMLLLGQGFLITQSAPWGTWAHLYWREAPYFQVDTPPREPRSYVILTPISYSLIAPQFPQESRWMNASAPIPGARERERGRKWLMAARSLTLVAPSMPSHTTDDGQPTEGVIRVFNQLIRSRGLSVVPGARCELLHSRGLVTMERRNAGDADSARIGFWLCPLRFDPAAYFAEPAQPAGGKQPIDEVFDGVEKLCPRFFPPGEARTEYIGGGAMRHYSESDTRVYVMDDGEVLYKFWRSLNAVTIGTRQDVLAGKVHVDCTRIRAPIWRNGGL